MILKNSALSLCSFAILGFLNAFAIDKPVFQTGVQMGYSYGQNGVGWPLFTQDLLSNRGRGGFYVSQLRLKGGIAFDSTFSAVAVGNLYTADVQEVYVEKRFDKYSFRAGKFRGAGLKSASGTDEFERTGINAPYYSRYWGYYKRLINFRDFGVQVEADYFGGNVKHRLFIHNANRENVFADEPSGAGPSNTQALGFDYALDWRISPFTVWGGHLGALANHEWGEFTGTHKAWEVGYWFKSNPLVDASLNHQLDVGKFHMFNEALLMYNRDLPNPSDGAATKNWGVSSQVRFDPSARGGYFFRYEFFDNTDGYNPDDALHLFTLGGIFTPSPQSYPGLKVTGEYVRTLEEGATNIVPNDVLFCQLQMVF